MFAHRSGKEGKGVYPGVGGAWYLSLYWQCVLYSVSKEMGD